MSHLWHPPFLRQHNIVRRLEIFHPAVFRMKETSLFPDNLPHDLSHRN